MHWINVVALTVLFMSGLQIFNAYPVLHFGKSSYDGTPHAVGVAPSLVALAPQSLQRSDRPGGQGGPHCAA